MPKYRAELNGEELDIFEAPDKSTALEQLARNAGFDDFDQMREEEGALEGLTLRQVEE